MEPTFKCPACNGRLALWAIRAEFVCPHCGMILRSNRAQALSKAFWTGLIVETLILAMLFLLLDVPLRAFIIWSSMGSLFGLFAGWLVIKHSMTFKPLRRKSATGAFT
jgi:predicted RNA-binding Zn-ribbon protein involved in translation (DUF1610 family)